MIDWTEPVLVGMEGRRARRTRIGELIRVVTGNRGWRRPFLDAYPEFDSYQGTAELNRGQAGRSDDPALLRALEEWIPKVIENLPEWYQKQNHLISNPFDLEA